MSDTPGIRLNKFLADSGACSRREADEWIADGHVTVNGARGETGQRVLPGDDVRAHGKPVRPERRMAYVLLYKPEGIVCTADPREPMNVIDYIGHPLRIFPVGRLDKDSSGLLLLTNDGGIVNRVLRAGNGHEKEYIVTVNKPLTDAFLRDMARGVPILDRVTRRCEVRREGERRFRIVLTEGLNRQIRRMCEALGYDVVKLVRVRIMNLYIDGLTPGQWRYLTRDELEGLRAATSASVEAPGGAEGWED